MEHGLAGSTLGDLRGLSIVLCVYYGIYLGDYYLSEFTSGIFYCYLSFAGIYCIITCHHNSAVLVLTNSALPLIFYCH